MVGVVVGWNDERGQNASPDNMDGVARDKVIRKRHLIVISKASVWFLIYKLTFPNRSADPNDALCGDFGDRSTTIDKTTTKQHLSLSPSCHHQQWTQTTPKLGPRPPPANPAAPIPRPPPRVRPHASSDHHRPRPPAHHGAAGAHPPRSRSRCCKAPVSGAQTRSMRATTAARPCSSRARLAWPRSWPGRASWSWTRGA